jgi:protein involved in polysaccharide export with SLBB domain
MPDANARHYNLNSFMEDGNMDEMPRLQDGDVVVLLSRERTDKVKVIGGVRNPGFFELEGNLNLFEIIYMAGGPAEKADLSRVRRFFRHDGKSVEETINLQSYIDNGKMDEIPLVEEGDVIIVYTKWFNWKTLMTVLNNTLLFIVTLQAFANIFNK